MSALHTDRQTRPRGLVLRSEEIDCAGRALEAMSAVLEVPGVVSVSTHVDAHLLFVVTAQPDGECQLQRAMEAAGFPLTV